MVRNVEFIGIKFTAGNAREVFHHSQNIRGLLVAPSASVLEACHSNTVLHESLSQADTAILDSSLMAMLGTLVTLQPLKKLSGPMYFELLIDDWIARKQVSAFWILPSERAVNKLRLWLDSIGLNSADHTFLLAPIYSTTGKIEDTQMLNHLTSQVSKDSEIVIAIGGGNQERLGMYLRNNLSNGSRIYCLGAAVAFRTGDQPPLPKWADRLNLGWFVRCYYNPKIFVWRFIKASAIIPRLINPRNWRTDTNRLGK